MKIRLSTQKLPAGYIFSIVAIAFIYIYILDYLAVYATGNYYQLGLILLTLIPLPFLALLLYFPNKKAILAIFVFFLVFIPSISNYLNVIGGKYFVISIEVFALLFLIFANHKEIKSQSLDWSLFIFISLWFIGNSFSILLAQDFQNSLPIYILSIFSVIPLVLIINLYSDDSDFLKKVIIPVFCFSIAVFSLSALAITYLDGGLGALNITSLLRPVIGGSGYLHNNSASGLALISLCLGSSILRINIERKKTSYAIIYLLFMLPSLLIILVDKSRSAFLSLFLILFTLFLFRISRLMRRQLNDRVSLRTKSFSIIIFIIFSFLIYLAYDSFLQRLAGDDTDFSIAGIIYNTLVSSRGAILLTSWNEFLSNPIFGKGYGNNLMYIPEFGQFWNSHNMLLEQLNATGLIGTIPIFYLLMTSFTRFFRERPNLSGPDQILANSIFVAILGFLAFGFMSGLELIGAYDVISAVPMLILVFLNLILISICKNESKQMR